MTTYTKNQIMANTEIAHMLEGLASGTPKPGMLLKQSSSGFAVHNVAGGRGQGIVMLENSLIDLSTVDTAAVSGDRIFMYKPQKGDLLNVRLKTGETVAIGDALISDGAGSFKPIASETVQQTYCYSQEAVTSAVSNPLILVRWHG